MKQVLCIDFGTSSIRAALRLDSGKIKVLPIGQITTRQDIDGASITSAVSIDADEDTVRFGQFAREAIVSGKPLAFSNSSPKLWLREPKLLDQCVISNVEITRRDLLTGLIAYTLFAVISSKFWPQNLSLRELEIRIAHPVWPDESKASADYAIRRIATTALEMAPEGDWGVTTCEILKSWTTPDEDEVLATNALGVDTLEPVAAAVELLPHIDNQRRVCAVIDVGAGTTDIGLFQHLVPDPSARKPERLIPIGPSNSVFQAGDAIDAVLLRLLENSNRPAFRKHEAQIRSRIRGLKEDLFNQSRLQILGIDLTLNELEADTEIQNIALAVRAGLVMCLSGSQRRLDTWYSAASDMERSIPVVMAGGGANLGFLLNTLKTPLEVGGSQYDFEVVTPKPPRMLDTQGAGYPRLAVALGGAKESYDTVIHEHAKLTRLAGLVAPKQYLAS